MVPPGTDPLKFLSVFYMCSVLGQEKNLLSLIKTRILLQMANKKVDAVKKIWSEFFYIFHIIDLFLKIFIR